MSPAESIRFHENKLLLEENFHYANLANSAMNPKLSTVYYWHKEWRNLHFGSLESPFETLVKKLELYGSQGEIPNQKYQTYPYQVYILSLQVLKCL